MRDIYIAMISWNLHGLAWPISKDPAGRMDRAGAKIRELSPDVVLLQEVWRGSYVDRLARALRPDWSPVYVGRSIGGPKGGLVAFVRADGWAIRRAPDFRVYLSSAPAWKIWEGDGLGGKGVLIVDLERDGQRVLFVDTHLQSQYDASDYCAVRESQLGELHAIVSQLDQTVPILVTGDFNTDWREPLYSRLAKLGTDLTAQARQQCDRGTVFDIKDGKPQWIDFVLARSPHIAAASLTLIANQRRDDPYSDHNGLFCSVSLKRQK
jgi:endonuclease/exonuclease/phosphatase family metal-dependent hydrolase